MDWKLKGYQSFSGEFLQTSVKISQRVIDKMTDSDLMNVRSICSDFERSLFAILSHYAHIAKEGYEYPETETETETAETDTETDVAKLGGIEEPENVAAKSARQTTSNGE